MLNFGNVKNLGHKMFKFERWHFDTSLGHTVPHWNNLSNVKTPDTCLEILKNTNLLHKWYFSIESLRFMFQNSILALKISYPLRPQCSTDGRNGAKTFKRLSQIDMLGSHAL